MHSCIDILDKILEQSTELLRQMDLDTKEYIVDSVDGLLDNIAT